ncbi:BTAD domain-containing putative transcriptional regulator [Streptomyces sp. NPDC047061]|uniref:AfsR/SARP family transcriptional regulator n=1 Tax=Streptomyces sp. NPDC047061 TaxID=3154605 RepID=UPI003402BE83
MSTTSSRSVRFTVLGPVRAWYGERELDLGSPQQRAVLVALLLRRGRPVTTAELIDAVWGEGVPAAAVSVLRTYVSRLRKVLEPERGAGSPPRVIVSAADGYRADVPDHAVDLRVFERQVDEVKRLSDEGRVSEAAALSRAALDAWQGTPLAGLPGPLAEAEGARLGEQRLGVVELCLNLDLQCGRHSEVIAELTSLTGEHPLREQQWRLLMLALYRSGRQAEALAAYRTIRSTLVTELGIEPGTALRELHDRILAADPALELAATAGRPEPPTAASAAGSVAHSPRPAQLPADLPAFTGRAPELARIRALLPDTDGLQATVVISAIGGMAGIGKTTLAVHWAHEIAHRFPDGQLYINLRGFDPTGAVMPPQEAIRVFLDALGVPPEHMPTGLDAQAALYRSLLAERQVLVVLDNARDTEQARPLLPGAPGCLVIVTSRNRLTGLIANEGAHPLTLDALTPAEAHDFLARRLGATRVTAEPRAAALITERCARLPLALAIVAARAASNPHFSLAAIADEIDDGLDAFAADDRTTDIRAVFSWSYRALSAPAQRLLNLLGLPTGSDISTPAAAALAGLGLRETRTLLRELTHSHLLTERQPGRYTLHDLLRAYAAERVHAHETPAERHRAVERVLAWYLHTAAATSPHLTPQREPVPLDPPPSGCAPLTFATREQAVDWCETERPNLVAAVHQAVASGHPGIAWRLPAALWGFFYIRGHFHDWRETTQVGLAAARGNHDEAGESRSHVNLAGALGQLRRYDEAADHLEQAAVLYGKLGDTYGMAMAAVNLGNVYLDARQPAKAVEPTLRGLAAHRSIGNSWGQVVALTNLGDAYEQLGRYDEAIECLEQALAESRGAGNRWVEGIVLGLRGLVDHRLRRHDDAVGHYRQALEVHREVGNSLGEGLVLGYLGDVQLAVGSTEEARASWRHALTIFERSEHPDAEGIRTKLADLERHSAVVERRTPRRAD